MHDLQKKVQVEHRVAAGIAQPWSDIICKDNGQQLTASFKFRLVLKSAFSKLHHEEYDLFEESLMQATQNEGQNRGVDTQLTSTLLEWLSEL